MKIAEFTNSVDLDEVAHHEPPHLDLQCLPSQLVRGPTSLASLNNVHVVLSV